MYPKLKIKQGVDSRGARGWVLRVLVNGAWHKVDAVFPRFSDACAAYDMLYGCHGKAA